MDIVLSLISMIAGLLVLAFCLNAGIRSYLAAFARSHSAPEETLIAPPHATLSRH